MSQYPGGNNPPPPYYGPPQWPPPPTAAPYPSHLYTHLDQPLSHTYPPGAPGVSGVPGVPAYPYYVPGTMMVPVPTMPMPMMPSQSAEQPSNPTYITNYIYHGESSNQVPLDTPAQFVDSPGDYDWIPTTSTTASHLQGKAVVGGHEGWDGSPLWVIRAWHAGDLLPGKLSVRHNAASVMHEGKEVPVQNIEVLCTKPEYLRWVPASNGNVPPGAVPGGRTSTGETLYVGRARHQLSITPGKVHPSHKCCYIGFGGSEVSHRVYDVLTRIS